MRALLHRLRHRERAAHERGQSLVEFALVFPVVVLLFIGLVEFAVTFSIMLNVNYASRDAALMAAEVGDHAGADCVILDKLDEALSGVSNKSEIVEVRIFWSDANGNELAANVYHRGGSTSCTFSNGTTVTVPYTLQPGSDYPDYERCTILAGCDPVVHPRLDTIGVAVTFHHAWLTPLPNLVQTAPGGVTFTRSNAMRMEPEL
jgi:Flp pilus assembly protein TadG